MTSVLLETIEGVLRVCNKPLSAKAISKELAEHGSAVVGGLTPWKTIGARLAVEIRSNEESPFMRVGPGLYALKAWNDLTAITVPARRINPLDEDILAIGRDTFDGMKANRQVGRLFDIHYRDLLGAARAVNRMQAEENHDLVQLIPSFIVFRENCVLSYKRTKKTPEQRLHDSYSILFGGHLQSDDNPALFAHIDDQVERFLFRELHEELAFDPPLRRSRYCGVLHLDETAFERQHAGVVFAIELDGDTEVRSLEPGFHSTLQFVPWASITASPVMADRWSATCIMHMLEA